MSTSNVFDAILGCQKIKWDATWNLLAWLLNPDEGHELGNAVTCLLSQHIFGAEAKTCDIRNEHNLGIAEDGRSRWADLTLCFPSKHEAASVAVLDDIDVRSPGSLRKLTNLRTYGILARRAYPTADVRVIAVTNAVREASLHRVRGIASRRLGAEAILHADGTRWHLLSLATIGVWVQSSLAATSTKSKVREILQDFSEWANSLERVDVPTRTPSSSDETE